MIVSGEDIAPDIAGIQNVWIQGVGWPRRSRTSAPEAPALTSEYISCESGAYGRPFRRLGVVSSAAAARKPAWLGEAWTCWCSPPRLAAQSSRRSASPSTANSARKTLSILGPSRRASACEVPSAKAKAARIGPPCVTARTRSPCVSCGELEQRRDGAPAHLLVALAVLPALVVVEPARELLGVPRLDLGARRAPARSPTSTSRSASTATGSRPCSAATTLRRLEGPSQRARVDGRELHALELGGELGRLRASGLVQRRVGVP